MVWTDAVVHWLHLMATAVWVGGSIFFVWVFSPIARAQLDPKTRASLMRQVGLKFKWFGWGSLAALGLTGLYKLGQIWDAVDFFDSFFGRTLLLKLALIGIILILSVLHDFVWGPALSRRMAGQEGGGPPDPKAHRRLAFWARLNLILAIAVVFASAVMLRSPY